MTKRQNIRNGDGLMSNLKSLSKVRNPRQLVKHVIKVQTENYNLTKNLVFNRQGYSPSSLQILDKYGNEKITAIRVYRMPLSKPLMTLFDAVTFRKFSQRLDNQDYDKLFHLRLDVRTDRGNMISFEKMSHIALSANQPTEKGSETMEVPLVPDITIIEFVDNTRKYMKEARFWQYRARDNNCQDLVLSCAKANNFVTPELETFIKQDTNALFDSYLRKLANTATELNGRVEIAMGNGLSGGCVNCKCEHCNSIRGTGILKDLKKFGKKLGKPFEKSVGINPFTAGYDLGHDVIAPALKKELRKM